MMCMYVSISNINYVLLCNNFLTMQNGYQPIHIAINYGQLEFYYFLVQKYSIDLNIANLVNFTLIYVHMQL